MTLIKRYVFAFIPMYSEIVALYCAFVIFATESAPTKVAFFFPAYLTGLFACTFINVLLARKERSFVLIVICNSLVVIFTIAAVLLSPHTLSGIFTYIYVLLICIYLAPRCVHLMRHPITLENMLTHSELSVFSAAFWLLLQFRDPGLDIVLLCFSSIVLNLIALSSLRIMRARQSGVHMPGIQKGFILVSVGAGAFIVAAFLGAMLLPALREVILRGLWAIVNGVAAVGRFIWGLVIMLLELIPYSGYDGYMPPMEAAQMPPPQEASEIFEIPIGAIYATLAVLAIIIAFGLLYLLYKMRKLRWRAVTMPPAIKKEKSKVPGIFSILLAALRRLYRKLALCMRLLVSFNTVAGVFVRIERRSKRRGYPRHPSEPPREFLLRVCDSVAKDKAEIRIAFLQFADKVDHLCFSSAALPNLKVDRLQRRVLLSCIKKA